MKHVQSLDEFLLNEEFGDVYQDDASAKRFFLEDEKQVSVAGFDSVKKPERIQKFLAKVGQDLELLHDEEGNPYLYRKLGKGDNMIAVKNNIKLKLKNGGFTGLRVYLHNLKKKGARLIGGEDVV